MKISRDSLHIQDQDTQELLKYMNIIETIAASYFTRHVSYDTIRQEILIKLYELGKSNGWDSLNPKLVWVIGKHKAIDLIRHSKKKSHNIQKLTPNVEYDVIVRGTDYDQIEPESDLELDTMLRDFIKLYAKDSEEKKAAEILLFYEKNISAEKLASKLNMPFCTGIELKNRILREFRIYIDFYNSKNFY